MAVAAVSKLFGSSFEAEKYRKSLREIFALSIPKQEKYAQLKEIIGSTSEFDSCLDLGSDNGTISMLLRELPGSWVSGDLSRQTVDAISLATCKQAYLVKAPWLPFNDNSFDLVVVVDMLEHIEDHHKFGAELARIIKPGGRLVVNTPVRTRFSILRHLKAHIWSVR